MHMYIYIHIYMYTNICTYIHIDVYICIYIHTNQYIYIHTHIHTYICICIYIDENRALLIDNRALVVQNRTNLIDIPCWQHCFQVPFVWRWAPFDHDRAYLLEYRSVLVEYRSILMWKRAHFIEYTFRAHFIRYGRFDKYPRACNAATRLDDGSVRTHFLQVWIHCCWYWTPLCVAVYCRVLQCVEVCLDSNLTYFFLDVIVLSVHNNFFSGLMCVGTCARAKLRACGRACVCVCACAYVRWWVRV